MKLTMLLQPTGYLIYQRHFFDSDPVKSNSGFNVKYNNYYCESGTLTADDGLLVVCATVSRVSTKQTELMWKCRAKSSGNSGFI